MFDINNLDQDEKFALLFGIMAGDGCLSLVKGKKQIYYYYWQFIRRFSFF